MRDSASSRIVTENPLIGTAVTGGDRTGIVSERVRSKFARCGEYRLGPANAPKFLETP